MNNSIADHVAQLMNTHRSIRQYKSDPLDDALIEKVLQQAVGGSSSSGNLNTYSMILTRDRARKARLCELHGDQEMINQAPLLITFCADTFRTRRWLRLRGARDNFNNLEGFLVSAVDAIILSQSVALGFESHGLGICYLGTTLWRADEIAELLELPETCVPITSLVAGYPDENPGKRDRLPLRALVHDERYQKRTDDEFLALYAEREVKGWNRYRSMGEEIIQEMERLGITTLAQYYTSEIKYPPEHSIEVSRRWHALLKAKGFDS
jgi:nitroreductase